MKTLTPAALLLPVVLTACQSTPPPVCPPASAAQQSRAQQTRIHTEALQRAGAINHRTLNLPAPVTADSQRVTVQWDGDAVELLEKLARQRGMHFVYTGTRLPLPVDVNVRDMTFANLLDLLRVQTGWRARIIRTGVELRLYFSAPQRGGRLT